MDKKHIFAAALLALLMLVLAGCGAKDAPAASATKAVTDAPAEAATAQPAAAASDDLEIALNTLTAEPRFIDHEANGVAMQLIALVNSSGEARLAYNTCQVCAGSPYAFFELKGDKLICQNCGNAFPLSAVGAAAGGCNPWPVSGVEIDGDSAVIPEEALLEMAPIFENWKSFA